VAAAGLAEALTAAVTEPAMSVGISTADIAARRKTRREALKLMQGRLIIMRTYGIAPEVVKSVTSAPQAPGGMKCKLHFKPVHLTH
jgi:hypothetical protein